ncbi:MAG: 3-methyl-2-oxobutanoate hydroxymethyltransferase [Verrucomicrobia bacterium]|jgi:3-methyl-2-oxobutanoate hydroxymethyltransferase|nr:3-methyl-2-oxobutanoate hydroxymethyltransferase [Verrucomicrobiota bacterium]
MKRATDFSRFKAENNPITMATCYDAWSARILAESPVDAVLVGDSVAMVAHGYPSTVHATTEMMATHTAAVRRGLGERFLVTDIPFPEHRKGVLPAMESVDRIAKAGADAVKIEGARGHLETVAHIVESGMPVMGHLGLTPQSVNQFGGYRVQARRQEEAERLLEDARLLQDAGIFALVLECIPAELAAEVTAHLRIPTIGIGSGVHCSGQILVLQDLLGMNLGFRPKFLRCFAEGADMMKEGLRRYDEEVKAGNYPSAEESFSHGKTVRH